MTEMIYLKRGPLASLTFAETFLEFIAAIRNTQLWAYFAVIDIKHRYVRTLLGPFWLVATSSIVVCTIGLLWSHLFQLQPSSFMPEFAVGYILWMFFSTTVAETSIAPITYENWIRQTRLSPLVPIMRVVFKNTIVLFHNLLVVVVVLQYFGLLRIHGFLLGIVSTFLFVVFVFFVSSVIAMVATRYRDVAQAIPPMLQLLFFFTPIVWPTNQLAELQWVATFNPLTSFLSLARSSFIGSEVEIVALAGSLLSITLGLLLFLTTYRYAARRLSYWL